MTHETLPAVTYASLEDYIIRAERAVFAQPPQRHRPIFRRAPNVPVLMLRNDCENRVLVFPGSFNPPHLDYISLLWHAMLCTDSKTIAAMFLLMPDKSVAKKACTEVDGKPFKLSVHQRTQLLQDDVLGRFTWVYPGTRPEEIWKYGAFMFQLRRLAHVDGYTVRFPSLQGGDAFDDFAGGEIGWGSGSILASNITRPIAFANEGGQCPKKLPKCGRWKQMHTTTTLVWHGKGEPPACWPCLPCGKLHALCPEFFLRHQGL